MSRNTILIVDDDAGFAQSLANMLAAAGHRTHVSPDAEGALALARIHDVDCALIDYNLGTTLGTVLLARLEEEGHGFPKIMITGYGDVRTATRAMKLGAADFVEKPYDPQELLQAIDAAVAKAGDAARAGQDASAARAKLRLLTDREREVVDAIVAGQSSRQIGEALSVSQRTVEAHRANILLKLGAANTASLVRLAVLAGMSPPQG